MKEFTYKWNLSDLKEVPKNGLKVFSCFACGGGSTMGYKMSGYEVVGCNEIDPEMAKVYKLNHSPKHLYLEDIRKFKLRENLPEELYNLDILDGSPPCSSFSMAGAREKGWGKEKVFREGQAKQTLDDLFFDYIDVAEKLKPKVVVAENVKGMLQGSAKGYVKEIVKRYNAIGYDVQIFLLNGATMGLPQRRERVFFICKRRDLNLPKVNLKFNEKPILYKEIHTGAGVAAKYYEKRYGDVVLTHNKVPNTLCSTNRYFNYKKEIIPIGEMLRIGSYPLDYVFGKAKPGYQIGMSVPPLMIHKLSREIAKQLFGVKYGSTER